MEQAIFFAESNGYDWSKAEIEANVYFKRQIISPRTSDSINNKYDIKAGSA